MLTHKAIWEAIDRLAEAHNLTASGLARRAGLDPTTFNRSKRFASDGRPRWPSTESIAKILRATNATPRDLFDPIEPRRRNDVPAADAVPFLGETRPGGLLVDRLDGAAAAPAGGRAIRLVTEDTRPVYALTVHGASMEPVFRDGSTIVFSLSAPIEIDHRVVVKTGPDVLVKVLADATETAFTFDGVARG